MFTEKELLIIRDALHEERDRAKRIKDPMRYNACTVLIGKAATAGSIQTKRAAIASRVSAEIKAFAERCEAEDYTDTGEAWELLHDAKRALLNCGRLA